jgi:hypothetical protein
MHQSMLRSRPGRYAPTVSPAILVGQHAVRKKPARTSEWTLPQLVIILAGNPLYRALWEALVRWCTDRVELPPRIRAALAAKGLLNEGGGLKRGLIPLDLHIARTGEVPKLTRLVKDA